MAVGYQLKKGGSRINNLMLMADIKLFGSGTKEIDTLVQTVRITSGDISMEFGIEKCAHVNIQRGKVTRSEGIQLPDGNNIRDIDETGYKCLGIIKGEEIKHQEMEEKIKKRIHSEIKSNTKDKSQLWKYCESHKLMGSTSNQVAYSAGIADWKNSDIHNMDRKTRKVQNMYQALHLR